MSSALRGGLSRLDVTTRFTLAVLALASGVYTYLGVRGLLDGTASIVFFGALIYASAVSVGIYCFWSYLMRFLPHVEDHFARVWLYVSMAVGSLMIIAMSSWLNAAALAGSAALEQHLSETTERYQRNLDQAHSNALAAQSLLPDIKLAQRRFADLSKREQSSGALTGTRGAGTVVALLTQMSTQLDRLSVQIQESEAQVTSLFREGRRHLERMRELVSASGPIAQRSDKYAAEAVALLGVIGKLEQTSIAPAVKRAADDLGRNFIPPVADGGTAQLVERQNEVVGNVERSVRLQSRQLSRAADEILKREAVVPARFEPLSTAEAVLRYAGDFIPSWAGAISIDLLPGVLIFMLCVVHMVIRRQEGVEAEDHDMSAADLMKALRLYERLRDHAATHATQTAAAATGADGHRPVETTGRSQVPAVSPAPEPPAEPPDYTVDERVHPLTPVSQQGGGGGQR
ncbi:MAG: hypothetical protein AAFR04_05045 [Pseudomonadota bacterium]